MSPPISFLEPRILELIFTWKPCISEVTLHSINPHQTHSSIHFTSSEPPRWQMECSMGLVLSMGLNCFPPSLPPIICKVLKMLALSQLFELLQQRPSEESMYNLPGETLSHAWWQVPCLVFGICGIAHPFAPQLVYTLKKRKKKDKRRKVKIMRCISCNI